MIKVLKEERVKATSTPLLRIRRWYLMNLGVRLFRTTSTSSLSETNFLSIDGHFCSCLCASHGFVYILCWFSLYTSHLLLPSLLLSRNRVSGLDFSCLAFRSLISVVGVLIRNWIAAIWLYSLEKLGDDLGSTFGVQTRFAMRSRGVDRNT